MTSEFSAFIARLREFIGFSADPSRNGVDAAADLDFNRLASELFQLQYEHNVAYRRFVQARGHAPDTVGHWSKTPAMPISAFKELDLTCLPARKRVTVFHSSGTTGRRPSRHFHSAASLEVYAASLWPWFARHVVPDLRFTIYDSRATGQPTSGAENQTAGNGQPGPGGPKLTLLTPSPSDAPHSSLARMFEIVRCKLAAPNSSFLGTLAADGAWTLDFDAALSALREAADSHCPLVLLGTAFTFVRLLDFLAGQNLRFALPAGSRAMETGGYKGRSRVLPRAELHALITERLGIPPAGIVCEYGMSELSSQAYDLSLDDSRISQQGSRFTFHVSRTFHFPPWARAQVISPETGCVAADGETGLLRIYDLANVCSVMAIQTEDLGVRRGDGFELIGRDASVEPRGCSLMAM